MYNTENVLVMNLNLDDTDTESRIVYITKFLYNYFGIVDEVLKKKLKKSIRWLAEQYTKKEKYKGETLLCLHISSCEKFSNKYGRYLIDKYELELDRTGLEICLFKSGTVSLTKIFTRMNSEGNELRRIVRNEIFYMSIGDNISSLSPKKYASRIKKLNPICEDI